MKDSDEGQARLKRQIDRENEYISRCMEKHDTGEQVKKKAKPTTEASTAGGGRRSTTTNGCLSSTSTRT